MNDGNSRSEPKRSSSSHVEWNEGKVDKITANVITQTLAVQIVYVRALLKYKWRTRV